MSHTVFVTFDFWQREGRLWKGVVVRLFNQPVSVAPGEF